MSLAIAIGMWWYVYLEHNPMSRSTVSVPVMYTGLSKEHAVSSGPRAIELRLGGTRAVLDRIDPAGFIAEARMNDMQVGMHRVPLQITNRTQARIVGGPYIVEARVVRLRHRRMPVRIVFTVGSGADTSISQAEVKPAEVEVYGTLQEIGRVSRVVAQVDAVWRKQSFRRSVPVSAQDVFGNLLPGIRLDPEDVIVAVDITEQASHTVPVSAQFEGESVPGTVIPASVMISGNSSVMAGVHRISTQAIDGRRCDAGGSFPVKLVPIKGVRVNVTTVTFTCGSAGPSGEVTLDAPVETINARADLEAKVDPPRIEVVVTGDEESLKGLTSRDINAMVDLTDVKEGVHRVAPVVHFRTERTGLEIRFKPAVVQVTVRAKQGE